MGRRSLSLLAGGLSGHVLLQGGERCHRRNTSSAGSAQSSTTPRSRRRLTPPTLAYGTKTRQPPDLRFLRESLWTRRTWALVDASTNSAIQEKRFTLICTGTHTNRKGSPAQHAVVIATGSDAMTGPLQNLGIKGHRRQRRWCKNLRGQTPASLSAHGIRGLPSVRGRRPAEPLGYIEPTGPRSSGILSGSRNTSFPYAKKQAKNQ